MVEKVDDEAAKGKLKNEVRLLGLLLVEFAIMAFRKNMDFLRISWDSLRKVSAETDVPLFIWYCRGFFPLQSLRFCSAPTNIHQQLI